MTNQKPIKRVSIKPGCITCGLCEFIAPEVFQVSDISHVQEGANLEEYASQITEAVESCPVQVIEAHRE